MKERQVPVSPAVGKRARELSESYWLYIAQRTDRSFLRLFGLQMGVIIVAAWVISPHLWPAAERSEHLHIWAAVLAAGLSAGLASALAWKRPGLRSTRYAVAAAQMAVSAALIHLSGGRIEAHFHVFGSLAFLAFYFDCKVLRTAFAVAAADHFLRGLLWPESIFGAAQAVFWRPAEHMAWLVFANIFLMSSCRWGVKSVWKRSLQQAELETIHERTEAEVRQRTAKLRRSEEALQASARELEQKNAELSRAHEAALEMARLKSEFVATVSHEIRTPLNAVTGLTSLLLESRLSGEQREHAELIRKSADSLLSIINSILDFSKIEAGRFKLDEVRFKLADAVEEAAGALAGAAQSKDVELIVNLAGNLPREVKGDPVRLRQVLTNLISNAVKFTDRGEIEVRAETAGESGGAPQLKFSVRDTGMGISPQDKPRLFEAFSQADGSTSRKHGGTGLGLSISKKLVEMMGGAIDADGEPGRGSTFWFTVRMQKVPPRETTTASWRLGERLLGRQVLVLCANDTLRSVLCSYLTQWGLKPFGAAVADEAAAGAEKAADGRALDLIVADWEIAGRPGAEERLRRVSGQSDAPPAGIALTPRKRKQPDKNFSPLQGWVRLAKPVRKDDLLRAVLAAFGAAPPTPPQKAAPACRYGGSPEDNGKKTRVLVAEDNPVNQKLAVKLLNKAGFETDVAADGREAVQAAAGKLYDVILMDCQMPEVDGYEAAAKIRALGGRAAATPIIALTAHAMAGDREKCLAAGMDDYLSKPVDAHKLIGAVQRWRRKQSQCRIDVEDAVWELQAYVDAFPLRPRSPRPADGSDPQAAPAQDGRNNETRDGGGDQTHNAFSSAAPSVADKTRDHREEPHSSD